MKISDIIKLHTNREEREFAKCRSRFGMTDAERRERQRKQDMRERLFYAVLAMIVALALIDMVSK